MKILSSGVKLCSTNYFNYTEGHTCMEYSFWCLDTIGECSGHKVGGGGEGT